MSQSGKSGYNRKKHQKFSGRRDEAQKFGKVSDSLFSDGKFEKSKTSIHERLRWTAPELPDNPITTPNCKWCGKQITEITTAICDKETGLPVHFECVQNRIAETEKLETNDSVCYIGGGRFGIIHYNNPPDMRDFTIKKIFEWEEKDTNFNNDWRKPISEYFSIT